MPYAVELFFDAATEAAVLRLWDATIDAGVAAPTLRDRYRPHVTLGVCRDLRDPEAFRRALAGFAAEQAGPPPVALEFLGLFPGDEGVVFYGVTVTAPLLLLHRRFHGLLSSHGIETWLQYEPGRWVPHCTLAYGLTPEAFAPCLSLLRDRTSAPLAGQFGAVALIEIPSGVATAEFALGPSPHPGG